MTPALAAGAFGTGDVPSSVNPVSGQARSHVLLNPRRGFYVVVPPQFLS
jgi:hypothetical protein